MTALIKVKGRLDPIRVSDEIAQSVKTKWADMENVPRNAIIDLGEWAGELREIKSIDIEKENFNGEPVTNIDKTKEEEKEAIKNFQNLTPEEKIKRSYSRLIHFGFRTRYKLENEQLEPSPELMKTAEETALAYFREHPEAYAIPAEIWQPLL